MIPEQTAVLLIIVAEVLSFLVLMALLVVLYRVLITRYRRREAPRDIEASPAQSPSPSPLQEHKEVLLHPALRINTQVNTSTSPSPPLAPTPAPTPASILSVSAPAPAPTPAKPAPVVIKTSAADLANEPSHTGPKFFRPMGDQLQYNYLLSRMNARPQSQSIPGSRPTRTAPSSPRQKAPMSSPTRPLRPITTTLLPPKRPMLPVIQESVARGSVNVTSPALVDIRPARAAYRMI